MPAVDAINPLRCRFAPVWPDGPVCSPARLPPGVTDIHMPGELTGLDLVEHARERYPAMPIVVATGRPDAAPSEWRDRHRVKLLTKPYGPERLVRTVDSLLEGKEGITRARCF